MKTVILILLTVLAVNAQSASSINNASGNRDGVKNVSYTTLVQVTYTSATLHTSVYYLTVNTRSTVTIDNKVNTGTVYALFLPTSYTTTVHQSTAAGASMEAVLTATEKTWKAGDGEICLDCVWLHIINAAGFKVPLKRTF